MANLATSGVTETFFITADILNPYISGEKQVKKLEVPKIEGNKIIFKNKGGQKFVLSHDNGMLMDNYTVDKNTKWASRLMTVFNKFYDEKTGCISAKKITDIGTEIDTRYSPCRGGGYCRIDLNRVLRNALSDYTNPNSDGGADITDKEIYDYYERCASIIPKECDYFVLKTK